jgi:HPt (histidine-containing phosphotransfer) domain-containing protein
MAVFSPLATIKRLTTAQPGAPEAAMLGRFELRRILGQGAQSVVWLAFDPRLEREVAIKQMKLDQGTDAATLSQWGSFVDQHTDDAQQLEHQLAEGDLVNAQRLMHTLKGTAGTLGALKVQDIATRLDTALKAQRRGNGLGPTHADMDALKREMMALAAALPNPPALAPTQAPTPADPEGLRRVLHELETLLTQSDTAAITLYQANASPLNAAWGSASTKLAHQILHFEFEAARDQLHRLRK